MKMMLATSEFVSRRKAVFISVDEENVGGKEIEARSEA
jgi:hypothetical protein